MKHSNRFYNFFKGIEITAAILLIIAFFLPWFSNPVVTAGGYNIIRFLKFIEAFKPVAMIIAAITILIPVGAVALLIMNALKKSTGFLAMITGMIPMVMMIVLTFKCRYIIPQCRFGLYITLFGAAALLLTGACNELLLSFQKEKDNREHKRKE